MGVAQFADEDGYCWPGQKMLAEYTEQSERTVREHLVWLESNGYLSRCSRKRPDGTNASDAYYLNLQLPPAEFKTKRKKQPADFAASEKPKTTRQISPAANFASGEKPQNQPAKSAGHEPVIDKPKGLSEPIRATANGAPLPEWLDAAAWTDWEGHRREIKHPMTPRSEKACLEELAEFRSTGGDPAALIRRCIALKYRGLFASAMQSSAPKATQAPSRHSVSGKDYAKGVDESGMLL
ncbi:helix-turn-helix domain-containing protein [Burkholderia contaminans]|uniref:helix-turn-helix domain-containing protein n=1 Tax=Burkholderia TaxID=32008 RepID=UPI001485BC3B|nr:MULTISPECIES: helix-turn-helix domain-containing protein [Burkholderia]MBD1412889.1 helix-turn-helix domain-containing protein [Burkholderia contaminans]UXZ68661.1 helix-turn-helix domain-containing protein [Burkholderia contaminans]UXZ76422.1 helix-turn-helix domain-containing protein [Burkholderia contaminans]